MTTTIGTDISIAAALLKNDELVAVPTETVYGLAGNALSENAIAKIYAAKNRPQFNPLIMHLPSLESILLYAQVNEEILNVLKHFMPGPFTVLLPKKMNVPDLLTAGSNKVAVRIPAHELTQQLLAAVQFPLAAPSANPSGYISPVSAQHVYEGLNGKIAYILDGGECTVGIESTIAEIQNNEIIVHRLGGLSLEEIKTKSGLNVRIETQHDKPTTSGQLKSHYAPNTPLYVGDIEKRIAENKDKKIAVISFHTTYKGNNISNYILSEKKDFTEAASKLFKVLRETDNGEYNVILAEKFPEEHLGPAINDRLNRAQEIYK
jgi:L-threonylcarbamoyladenylate synthase